MQRPFVSWLARLTPYGVAALLSLGFSTSGVVETLNLLLYDTGVQLRQQPSGQHTPIRLIGISESDIQRYGWPINDELLAKALERLDQAGSSAIGLDLYRDGPVEPGHESFTAAIKNNPKLIGIFSLAGGVPPPPALPAAPAPGPAASLCALMSHGWRAAAAPVSRSGPRALAACAPLSPAWLV